MNFVQQLNTGKTAMKTVFYFFLIICMNGVAFAQEAHQLFTEVLQEYVHAGKVNYRDLCKDPRLDSYLEQLSDTNPDTIATREDQLAFWINAYNAFTIKAICEKYPVKSINELHFGGLYIGTLLKKTVWDKQFIVIHGEQMSLNHIEHEIVRPLFHDPRAHFALVCASVSCPPLRSEAFEGAKLNEQLEDQGRVFFSETYKNYFDAERKEAHLSKILDWYAKDFGEDDAAVLRFVARFLPADLAGQILSDPQAWRVRYTDYDWNLNE